MFSSSQRFYSLGFDAWTLKVGVQVEELKKSIEDLKLTLQAAKDKQTAAKDECRKLEKDMDEFKNNKEGKIDELKVRWSNARLNDFLSSSSPTFCRRIS